MINAGESIIVNNCRIGYLPNRMVFYLMNLHIKAHHTYFARVSSYIVRPCISLPNNYTGWGMCRWRTFIQSGRRAHSWGRLICPASYRSPSQTSWARAKIVHCTRRVARCCQAAYYMDIYPKENSWDGDPFAEQRVQSQAKTADESTEPGWSWEVLWGADKGAVPRRSEEAQAGSIPP